MSGGMSGFPSGTGEPDNSGEERGQTVRFIGHNRGIMILEHIFENKEDTKWGGSKSWNGYGGGWKTAA